MPTRELTTERKVLEPIMGSRVGVYNALQNLKRQHTDLVPVEYPHEVSRGQWRTVVSVPATTPRKITVRSGVKFKITPRVAAYVALGLTVAGALGFVVWAVAIAVAWVIAHMAMIIGFGAVVLILTCLVGGRACTHADHH